MATHSRILAWKIPWTEEPGGQLFMGSQRVRHDSTHPRFSFPWDIYESFSVVSDSLQPHGLYSPWNFPGQNTGVGSLSLLQGIFPTQRSNPDLPHCRWILNQLSYKGSPRRLEWVAYLYSRGSSRPTNWTRVFCTVGGFFTNWAIREAQIQVSCVLVSQAYLTLCDPMDCSPPCSSVLGFPRQEYWSGLPCPSPGIFPTQESNLDLLHCRQILYHLSHQGSPLEVYGGHKLH